MEIFLYFSVKVINMYILKTKGTSKIPDYVQVRDNDLSLIAQFKAKCPERAILNCGLSAQSNLIKDIIANSEYGELIKIDEN